LTTPAQRGLQSAAALKHRPRGQVHAVEDEYVKARQHDGTLFRHHARIPFAESESPLERPEVGRSALGQDVELVNLKRAIL
jgi:hypothetical protein